LLFSAPRIELSLMHIKKTSRNLRGVFAYSALKISLHEPVHPFGHHGVCLEIVLREVRLDVQHGVPSMASSPAQRKGVSFRHRITTAVKPMGFGMSLTRWEKMPTSRMSARPCGLRTRCFSGMYSLVQVVDDDGVAEACQAQSDHFRTHRRG
jgi:hypothetical protein